MKLAELTSKWIDRPYGELSCIGFVHAFLTEATGKTIPREFRGLSIDNYHDRWREDQEAVNKAMCAAVEALTTPSNPKWPHLLDLLIVEVKGAGLMPAVYVGNGHAIANFIRSGVTVFDLDKNNQAIIAGSI